MLVVVSSRHPKQIDKTLEDIRKLKSFPTLRLGQWPTPLSSVTLSSSHRILVKHDDLSKFGRSGAKTRKLESLLGYALTHGYKELITGAGNISNLAYDLSLLQTKYGIRFRLFFGNRPRMKRAARESLFANVTCRKHFLGRSDLWISAHMRAYHAWLNLRGKRTLMVPPSLAGPAGVIGAARGFLELSEQLGDAPLHTVFITAASGCTQAGFVLAECLLRQTGKAPTQICGVKVGWGPTKTWIHKLIRATEKTLHLDQRTSPDAVVVNTEMAHYGFGNFDSDLVGLCEQVARDHGIQLDPVYGGKTWHVMQRFLKERGERLEDNRVLYWHCGYTPDWRQFSTHGNVAKLCESHRST